MAFGLVEGLSTDVLDVLLEMAKESAPCSEAKLLHELFDLVPCTSSSRSFKENRHAEGGLLKLSPVRLRVSGRRDDGHAANRRAPGTMCIFIVTIVRREPELVKSRCTEIFRETAEEAVGGEAYRLTAASPVAATPLGGVGHRAVDSVTGQSLDAVEEEVIAVHVAGAAALLHTATKRVVAQLGLVSAPILHTTDLHNGSMVFPLAW